MQSYPSGQNFYWPTYADDGRSSGQGDNARTRPTVRPEIGRTWQILGRTVAQRLARQMARRCYAYAYLGPYRRPTSGPINGQMRRNSMLLSVDFREIFPVQPRMRPLEQGRPPPGDRNRSPPSWVPIIQTHNSNQIYRPPFPRAREQGGSDPTGIAPFVFTSHRGPRKAPSLLPALGPEEKAACVSSVYFI